MLDLEKLRSEVSKAHNKRLDANDPIFMFVTLNELLLANYLEQFKTQQDAQMEALQKQQAEFIKDSEEASRNLINKSMVAMQENYEAKETAFSETLEQRGQSMVKTIEEKLKGSFEQPKTSIQQQLLMLTPVVLLSIGLGMLVQKVCFSH